ncbi:MAG: pyridine nucleotide-disulfide oxidoreductase [Candidatus Asgardarchaeum californiense]|nr:MAG: pyridine nucleotide-disulfide oxidoreductase [Candidatus Asgardarchaeum californiense]
MEKTDVLIIGGSASGIVTAVTGKSSYPDKDFMVIRKEKQAIVPCGIPYIFGSLESSEKNLVHDGVLEKAGVKLKVDKAVSVDIDKKICKTADGTEISFDKLVFATGSDTKTPKWLKGTDKENVFTIPKNKEYLDKLLNKLKNCKKIVTIGGGFIGVEVSDELTKRDKDITIVEILPHILSLAFDEEMAIKAEELLKSRGVKISSGTGVKEIIGDAKVTGILLDNGKKLDADAVILSMGYRPNTILAEKAGVALNEMGFIKVDEYMRTENPDIFAVGDCAEKKDFFTRKTSGIMLASTACAEARIAGMSLYKLSAVKTFAGTIAIFSTVIGNTGFGVAGLTEKMARKEGFDIVTGSFEGLDKHPGTLPGVNKQMIKLIVAKESGIILGGGVIGGASAGELTNILGFAIQNKMTVNTLLTAQIGTHPLLTAPPTAYPIIKAAEVVSKKLYFN